MKRLLPLALIALAVWLAALAGIHWSRAQKPTPEKLAAFLAERGRMDSLPPAKRAEVIQRVARDLNRLTLEERQELRRGTSRFDEFFTQLTPDERSEFLDLTLPEGFKQMMAAFNKMNPERRKRFIQRALDDLDKIENEGMRPAERALEEESMQKIINSGLESFYNDANAEVKLEMAPVIERLQQVMQNLR